MNLSRIIIGLVLLALLCAWAHYSCPYPDLAEILGNQQKYAGQRIAIFIESRVAERTKDRKTVFIALFSGALFHFLLDAPQKHIAAGYFWLFPFSWTTYEWGLWWSEDSVQIVPGVILLVAVVEIIIYRRKVKRSLQR